MIIDNELVLDAAQSFASADQTASIDLKAAGALEAKAAYLRALVTTAGTGTGTVTLAVQDSADNSSFSTIVSGPAKVGSTLTKGTVLKVPIPADVRRYVRAAVVVSGTLTGTAFVDIELG